MVANLPTVSQLVSDRVNNVILKPSVGIHLPRGCSHVCDVVNPYFWKLRVCIPSLKGYIIPIDKLDFGDYLNWLKNRSPLPHKSLLLWLVLCQKLELDGTDQKQNWEEVWCWARTGMTDCKGWQFCLALRQRGGFCSFPAPVSISPFLLSSNHWF